MAKINVNKQLTKCKQTAETKQKQNKTKQNKNKTKAASKVQQEVTAERLLDKWTNKQKQKQTKTNKTKQKQNKNKNKTKK